jgi:hypothetical protein
VSGRPAAGHLYGDRPCGGPGIAEVPVFPALLCSRRQQQNMFPQARCRQHRVSACVRPWFHRALDACHARLLPTVMPIRLSLICVMVGPLPDARTRRPVLGEKPLRAHH